MESVFRESKCDQDGFLLERRCAFVFSTDALVAMFSGVIPSALRILADKIESGEAMNEADEHHVVELAGGEFVGVDIVSLDGLVYCEANDEAIDLSDMHAMSLLSDAERAAIIQE